MELYHRAFQIQSEFGGRNLFQYLLAGDRSVLIDSGTAKTPETTILCYMDRVRFDPARLTFLITTHPDLDHQGGNAAIRKAAPQALLACGEEDREMVSDPNTLYSERYNHLKHDHGVGFDEQPSPEAGTRCRVDLGFRGGERISLADNWELQVLHVPGHSRGHLTLYDRRHQSAFVSDAIHGHGCPGVNGQMAIPVTYYYIDTYLATLQYFEGLEIQHLYSGHWPNMHGDEISDFLSDSRRTVDRLEARILRGLLHLPKGLTLRELIVEVREEFPEWPTETLDLAMFAVHGHLEHLQQTGKVITSTSTSPWRYRLA